jgi:hypothetical protein
MSVADLLDYRQDNGYNTVIRHQNAQFGLDPKQQTLR